MITSPKHSLPAEEKQFRLVKFFAWASFIVLLIFSFPFSMVISQQAKDFFMKSYENYALLIGENLNHQVFQNFVIPVTRRYGAIKLRQQEQYELMNRIVHNTIHGFNVDIVNIYDIGKGVIAYSTDPEKIGLKVKETEGYRQAVQGKLSSGMVADRDDFWRLGLELMGWEKKLRTYIPFRGANTFFGSESYVAGVFEVIQDLTKEYESIVRLQLIIFGLSILIMGLIFFALLLIVHKAEQIIEQRAQEQRELVEQLHQAERLAALGEMVAGISHEIKNPLGIIHSTAELMGEMPDASETQKRFSGVVKEEAGRLNRTVTEFLDFARPQVPNLRECRLEDIIEKNLSFLQPEFERKKITVNHNIDGRAFKLKADQDLLYRAFLNVLINAMQSMEEGGTLNIRLGTEQKALWLEIGDTGGGISPEVLKKIFNPFFTTKEKGTGLGLSIVRKIIEGHDGVVHIESTEGAGTTVTFQLPRRR
jgi:signal transduction histidine kinase